MLRHLRNLFPLSRLGKYYRESNSNVHRGVYELAEEAENLYYKAKGYLQLFQCF